MKIGLFVEGTYPFTRGGVSEWVHSLIRANPDDEFVVFHLSPRFKKATDERYLLDRPRVSLVQVPLFERPSKVRKSNRSAKLDGMELLFNEDLEIRTDQVGKLISSVRSYQKRFKKIEDLIHSHAGFQFIEEEYQRLGGDTGWIDGFYQIRSALLPVLRLLSTDWPVCDLYHAVSTGYAGLAATCAHLIHRKPFIISEHGIYSFERELELATVSWIPPDFERETLQDITHHRMRSWWRRHYEALAHVAYFHARKIISLTETNRTMQLKRRAPIERTEIISNGVDERFFKIQERRLESGNLPAQKTVFGFVGRVVAIKDIKTLIRAFGLAHAQLLQEGITSELHFYGPTDEEPEYAAECRELIQSLGVQDAVSWKGPQPPEEIYLSIDALVLTSVSEGQPLVLLESMAAGVPVIVTRAGPCEEIVGNSGLVCDIADSEALAHSIVIMAQDPTLRFQLGRKAAQIARARYQVGAVWSRYQQVYRECGEGLK